MSDILKHSDFKDGKATKLIKIEVLDGFEFSEFTTSRNGMFASFKNKQNKIVVCDLPITPGPHSFICGKCLNGIRYVYDEYSNPPNYEARWHVLDCAWCEGHPEIKADVKIEVIKKDNSYYFEITGREV